MTIGERTAKQILFLTIFLIIVGGIFFVAYRSGTQPEPTPTPILLKPIEVQLVKFLKIKDFDYDVIAKIRNPNANYGSLRVSYELRFFGQDGLLLNTLSAKTYILPGQTKYIIDAPVKQSEEISRVKLSIKNVKWEKLHDFLPQNISFVVTKKELLFKKVPGVFLSLNGIIFNASDFDFGKVDIISVLYDKDNNIVAVGKTDLRTVIARGDRAFDIKWPDEFQGWVDRTDVEIYTNVFENTNFLQKHGTQEKFQQFY